MPEADSSPDPKPAPRLGSYLLVEALGSGGMSNVFRAVHEETGSVVAVKVLPRTLAKNVTLLQRFMREAKSAEALDHPNIVAIYDRGFDQGRHYLVLEFVEGRDLHDRVRLNGPLSPGEAVGFIREVAGGLRYAAGLGMIHRDVKPANLLMAPDGHAKIIDLGLALQVSDEDERVTRDGTTVGTVDYMAPEQARDSRQTSERSDIYSLGCTFYYLLTGSPPYPGGGLSDKLARHYKAAIPEVREHRPDVPEPLSLLIRRMMEKKPEKRFADYTLLIEALDALGDPPTQEVSGESLDALIVDDDEVDVIGLAPTETAISRRKDDRPPSTRDHLLMAEIVDDDEDEPPRPTLPAPGPRPRAKDAPPRREPAAPAEVSLADLAALDADDPPAARRQARPSSSASTAKSPSSPSQSATRPQAQPAPTPSALIDEDEDEDEEVYGSAGPARRAGEELPLKTWIAAGAMVGIAIAIVGFGASMVISMTKPAKPAETAERPAEAEPEAEPPSSIAAPVIRADRVSGPVAKAKKAGPVAPTPPAEVAPVVVGPVEEKPYPPEWESRLGPPPSGRTVEVSDRQRTVVRRVVQAGNEPQTPSLAAALGKAGDLVEIADSGPFFEDDCQVAGKSRLIRAREGVRPMIKIEFTENAIIKEQAAKFVLGGAKVDHLVLEGLDLAVDVRDLPDRQTALFLCQGADLTLRDCSLTVLNANDPKRASRFSVFRVEEGARPNRIVLDRTTIRGPVRTLVDLAASRAEVVLDRSIVVGDSAPLIAMEAAEKPGRSFHFRRSVLASRGHLMEIPAKGPPPVVRALGTTFARVEGPNGPAPSLLATRAAFAGEAPSALDWSGEDNEFIGWAGWLSSGPEGSVRVAGLANIRAIWAGSDGSSRESSAPWASWPRPDEVAPADLAALAPSLRGTLAKVATPHPRLRDLTVGTLARLSTPELSTTLIAPAPIAAARPGNAAPAAPPKAAVMPPPQPNAKGPRPRVPPPMQGANGAAAPLQPPGPLSLTFNVQEAPWLGDLGLFLAEKLAKGTPQATIQVRGAGVHAMTPIRLPDGLSIAILGESAEGSNLPMPTFVPKPAALGRAMFELRGGDLAIANLSFSTEGAARPRHWVLSQGGLLAIKHCRFRDPAPANQGGAAPDVGPVVAFVAREAAPMAPRVGPFARATDRPAARLTNCLIWAAAGAISAEVGRGAVDLENCLIISGGPAFTLLPVDVPRDKFEADLVLDRCTVAVDHSAVVLGPLAGQPTGPARPWLVSTRRCAFPRTQVGGTGALLQVDADAMARAALFWQSTSDYYECAHFLASNGPAPASLPSVDLKKQWLDVWGIEHTKGDQGPNPRRNDPVLRYKDKEKPKPGRVVPGALELDASQKDVVGVAFKDLPASPRGGAAATIDAPGGVRSPTGLVPERP